ncbi:MAG: hypothetical protein ACNI22_06340 [Halarcobacter sp.]
MILLKKRVTEAVENEIANLNKGFDDRIKVDTSKAKKQIVSEILDELLSSDNVTLTQDELANIVLKKVA